MRKFHISVGLLLALAFPVLCPAQEATQIETAPPQEVEKLPLSAADEANCDYRFELSAAGDVCFPHKSHRKLGCGTCHHQSQARPLETPHPDYLTSSWKRYRNCLSCHFSNPDNIADETPSSKVALHENCWKCHEKGTGAEVSKRCPDCHLEEEK
jgi:hypothetical protein